MGQTKSESKIYISNRRWLFFKHINKYFCLITCFWNLLNRFFWLCTVQSSLDFFYPRFPPQQRRMKKSLFICTIEKAHALLNSLVTENRLKVSTAFWIRQIFVSWDYGGWFVVNYGPISMLTRINLDFWVLTMATTTTTNYGPICITLSNI